MNNKIDKAIFFFWMFLFILMIPAFARFLTRQILVKRFHMDNGIVQFIYARDVKLLNEAADYSGKLTYHPIDWENLYPFSENEQHDSNTDPDNTDNIIKSGPINNYAKKAESAKQDISNYLGKYYPLDVKIFMKSLSEGYNRFTMGREAALSLENIYLTNGRWLYTYNTDSKNPNLPSYPPEDIDKLADNVANFYDYLKTKDIGFLFATVSSKPCPYDNDLISPWAGKNPTVDYFLKKLDERNVPEYNLSEMMSHDPEKWYEMYYLTDNHWNDKAGLWASGVLADYLNNNTDLSFDPGIFNPSNYTEETRVNYYRGNEGRKISPVLSGKESYTRLIPKFCTKYTVTHYSEESVDMRQGNLTDVFFNNDRYNEMSSWSAIDHYDESKGDFRFIQNDDLYTIVNDASLNNKNRRILIIRDSFTGYLAPYISTDIERVDLIYLPKFTGSIRTYINETKPDAVIMLLGHSNIRPKWAVAGGNGYHFDLR